MLQDRIQETAAYLDAKLQAIGLRPTIAIILGTGLGNLGDELVDKTEFPYAEIPNFPVSTVVGHNGKLLLGHLAGHEVMAMQGRFHYYEGYSMQEVTFPIRVMHELGIKTLLVSNAAGGTNPDFEVGDMMIITDHINQFPDHPLRGNNLAYGPRFLDMHEAYSRELIHRADAIARREGIRLQHGIYLGTQGPTYETPAEYRLFRQMGADAVGMSTVPEVIVARHCGMAVFGVSVITNVGLKADGEASEASHSEIQDVANGVHAPMSRLIRELIKTID